MSKDLHENVHSSITYSSQKMETNQMFIGEWINKMWYTHAMDYSAIERNKILIYATTINEHWKHVKWEKLDTKDAIWYHSIYMKRPEKANLKRQKRD